jgi:putative ABC transport system permease protein
MEVVERPGEMGYGAGGSRRRTRRLIPIRGRLRLKVSAPSLGRRSPASDVSPASIPPRAAAPLRHQPLPSPPRLPGAHRRRAFSLLGAVQVALHSLASNKIRSALAMLGIIIGVGSVIATMALGEGAARQVETQIRDLGTNVLSVRPAALQQRGVRLGRGTTRILTHADTDALVRECPAVKAAAARVSGGLTLRYRNRNNRTDIFGVEPEFFTIVNATITKGRVFGPTEIANRARVCLLGEEIREDFFGDEPAVGKQITVAGQRYEVIGLIGPRGAFDDDFDDRVWVPITTAMDRVFNVRHVSGIEVQAVDQKQLAAAEEQVEAVLRRRHNVRDDQESPFQIRNQLHLLETASKTSQTFTFLLAGIACISLLVGGIGIMNIMLVSVVERTREIGIRRAVGARRRDILAQFLGEAVVMCALGAGLGIFAGIAACRAGAAYASWPMVMTTASVVLSCTTAVVIGIVFGLYPAARAANLSPMDALRTE